MADDAKARIAIPKIDQGPNSKDITGQSRKLRKRSRVERRRRRRRKIRNTSLVLSLIQFFLHCVSKIRRIQIFISI